MLTQAHMRFVLRFHENIKFKALESARSTQETDRIDAPDENPNLVLAAPFRVRVRRYTDQFRSVFPTSSVRQTELSPIRLLSLCSDCELRAPHDESVLQHAYHVATQVYSTTRSMAAIASGRPYR